MYIVIEIQNTAGNVAHLITDHATLAEAESKFHTILSYAATSALTCHAATILGDDGSLIRTERYVHATPAQTPADTGDDDE